MSQRQPARAEGSCLCGAVRFTIQGAMQDVSYCHCIMCQRASSHYVAYTACDDEALVVTDGHRKLKWYRSSPNARRAFCRNCGSQLFWKREASPQTSVSAGSLDQPTGLHAGRHLFAEHVADYDREAEAPAGH